MLFIFNILTICSYVVGGYLLVKLIILNFYTHLPYFHMTAVYILCTDRYCMDECERRAEHCQPSTMSNAFP